MDWYRETVGSDAVNAVATTARVGQSTLDRQVKRGELSPEIVVAIAYAYDVDPIEGLIISGLITEEDVVRHGAEVLLASLPDRMIADEVWDRMQRGTATEPITGSQPNLIAIEGSGVAAKDPGYSPEEENI